MKSLGHGVRQTISFTHLKDQVLIIPPIQEQQKIVKFLDEQTKLIDKICSIEEKRLELLKEYRKSLVSHTVSGKVRVSEDMI